jgi:hypothetical protein
MDQLPLPHDFKEFLQLLNSAEVEYLLIGGYAVGVHGYPRTTGDMDIWVAANATNAAKLTQVLLDFGFSASTVKPEMFVQANQVIRMGVPPVAIDIITSASGVEFTDCFRRRKSELIDGIEVPVIHCDDLKSNKKASGRPKDLNDLENLP